MPPAESRVKMNGFAAPDTAAGICSAAIKRGFAAPSPDFPAHNFIFSESNLRKILDSTKFNERRILFGSSQNHVSMKEQKRKSEYSEFTKIKYTPRKTADPA